MPRTHSFEQRRGSSLDRGLPCTSTCARYSPLGVLDALELHPAAARPLGESFRGLGRLAVLLNARLTGGPEIFLRQVGRSGGEPVTSSASRRGVPKVGMSPR